MNIFTTIILDLYNLLFHNLGLTIIVLGLGSRIIFIPSSVSMIKYQKKLQQLKPQLDEIRRKHKDDKKLQMTKQSELFKENGVNQASGCLNAIIQIVIAFTLYRALIGILKLPHLHTGFFIWNLTKPDVIHGLIGSIAVPGALVLFSAAAQLVLSKMMAPAKIVQEETAIVAKKDKMSKGEKEDITDTMTQMQSQMVFLFPAMILIFGLTLPAGLALYWAITTLFAIIQQYLLVGWGGLGDWLPKKVTSS